MSASSPGRRRQVGHILLSTLALLPRTVPPRSALLLGYAAVNDVEIREGVRRLADVCRASLAHAR